MTLWIFNKLSSTRFTGKLRLPAVNRPILDDLRRSAGWAVGHDLPRLFSCRPFYHYPCITTHYQSNKNREKTLDLECARSCRLASMITEIDFTIRQLRPKPKVSNWCCEPSSARQTNLPQIKDR